MKGVINKKKNEKKEYVAIAVRHEKHKDESKNRETYLTYFFLSAADYIKNKH
jgi:hypothetical protein